MVHCMYTYVKGDVFAHLQAHPEQERLEQAGVAVDFGCGSGRDAVYMAMQLPKPWKVVASLRQTGTHICRGC